jgi:hypothetical protein
VAADPATAFLEIKSLAGKILDRRPLSPRRRP